MAHNNYIELEGNLTKDSESGNNVTVFDIAVNGANDTVMYIRVKAFTQTDHLGNPLTNLLKKGTHVKVEGRLIVNMYNDKQYVAVVADKIFIGYPVLILPKKS